MVFFFFLCIFSFLFSYFLTPRIRDFAVLRGIVDHPDNRRKTHTTPIPRLGGIAILGSLAGAYAILVIGGLRGDGHIHNGMLLFSKILPAATLIFGVGLLDDIYDVSPWWKLITQVCAALLVWNSGIRLLAIGGHPFPVPVSLFATVLWIVACSNAINLIDGMDGLAAGAGVFAAVTTLIAGMLHGNLDLILATAPLVGALMGFLCFNFDPASIFLGDCGSLTIGFLLGCYGIVWSEKSSTIFAMTAPLLALSVPLLDVCVSIARRFLGRKPIFRADRRHIHHRLLSRGIGKRHAVLILYGFCGLAGTASLVMTATRQQYQGVVIVLVCLTAVVGLQHLGYEEFALAGKLFSANTIRRHLASRITLAGFEQELSEATTFNQCWEVICRNYSEFGFCGLKLVLDEVILHGDVYSQWHVRIDFPDYGYLVLMRKTNVVVNSSVVVFFVDCIATAFSSKLNDQLSTTRTDCVRERLENRTGTYDRLTDLATFKEGRPVQSSVDRMKFRTE